MINNVLFYVGMRFLAFINEIYKAFKDKNERFNANLFSLKIDKPYFIQFSTKNSSLTNLNIDDNKVISNIPNMKFRGIKVENTLSWKSYINVILPKISAACLVIRMVKPFMSLETENYASFHSIMNYGIIAWRNSSCITNIFRLQKRIIRIIMGARTRGSCRELQEIKYVPLQSQYIHSLALFVINKKN